MKIAVTASRIGPNQATGRSGSVSFRPSKAAQGKARRGMRPNAAINRSRETAPAQRRSRTRSPGAASFLLTLSPSRRFDHVRPEALLTAKAACTLMQVPVLYNCVRGFPRAAAGGGASAQAQGRCKVHSYPFYFKMSGSYISGTHPLYTNNSCTPPSNGTISFGKYGVVDVWDRQAAIRKCISHTGISNMSVGPFGATMWSCKPNKGSRVILAHCPATAHSARNTASPKSRPANCRWAVSRSRPSWA